MDQRASDLIRRLELRPHPEGGFYREIFGSARRVQPFDARGSRSALTLIHFLLVDRGASRWHRVSSDEAWTWVEGAPLELHRISSSLDDAARVMLGPPADGITPAAVIPARDWQAARTTGAYSLVTCAVGPGFDFADFAMLADDPRAADEVRRRFPDLAALI